MTFADGDHSRHLILVLGPMGVQDDVEESRTDQLRDLIAEILETMPETSRPGVVHEVRSPADRHENVLISSILTLIEQAELVVIDLTGGRFNTAYEVGLVHALGLPHIFVSADDRPPFYLQNAEVILNFDYIGRFDLQRRTHRYLQRRLRDFKSNTDIGNVVRFAGNEVTQFYQGLPIVDIAGPSGLAAGYYANFLRRVFGPKGLLGEDVDAEWTEIFGDTKNTRQKTLSVGGVIVVRPPGDGLDLPVNDAKKLSEALQLLGLGTRRVTLQPRDGDKRRTFGCELLTYRDTDAFVEPAIIVDIPTTLQSLQYAPRVRRLEVQARGSALGLRRKERVVRLMVDAFARNIRYHFNLEGDAGGNKPYYFVRLGHRLRSALTSLQVQLSEN